MARASRTTENVRRDIEWQREHLADAVEALRREMNFSAKLRGKLPAAAGAALGAGFVLAGGIGATIRLLFRRGREGREKARVGHYAVVDRD
jgi:hypothetical protein